MRGDGGVGLGDWVELYGRVPCGGCGEHVYPLRSSISSVSGGGTVPTCEICLLCKDCGHKAEGIARRPWGALGDAIDRFMSPHDLGRVGDPE